jgi:bilin biosynthesis protein
MEKRFSKLFNLTEEQAIALLDTPQAQINEESDSRYIAASHLVNYPTQQSIEALIRAVQNTDATLDNRIVRRKSVETLGWLQATQALPIVQSCLADDDCYTVENAVWAIGEIGTQDAVILETITQLLEKPGQTYRVIIHTLAKLNYRPALERIRKFVDADDKTVASAAISAMSRLTEDDSQLENIIAFLQHPNVLVRRLSIQDLIDTQCYRAIPAIARCPVSLVFRLRGIRLLAESGIPAGKITLAKVQPYLEQVLRDHPSDLNLVHTYDQQPSLPSLIQKLYETDFGRCYLATQTILDFYANTASEALLATYEAEAHNDYGAHYHVIKLLGWLKHAPAYHLLIENLHNRQPQFQKSRVACAIALGELGDPRAIPDLKVSLETKIWDLKYAAAMALDQLGVSISHKIVIDPSGWLVDAKISSL